MIMNLIDFDMDVQQAISAPRFSFRTELVRGGGRHACLRSGRARGHGPRRLRRRVGLGNAHGLTIEYGPRSRRPVRFTGGADPRGEGIAIGY